MENRFGFKDLVLCVLLLAILASIWVAIYGYDRQWEEIRRLAEEQRTQTSDIQELLRTVRQGVRLGDGSGQGGGLESIEAFERLRRAKAQPDYAPGDWVVDAFPVNVSTLTPLVSTDVYQSIVEGYVLEPLARRDPDTLDWQPLLARDWEIAEDGQSITFELRPEATFSDGEAVTASDVVFTFELLMNPEIDAPRARAYYRRFTEVEATDERTVVFRAEEPYFRLFEIAAGLTVMPEHFYSAYSASEFNRHPGLLMGSGPYRMRTPDGWRPGETIELRRNERYWGERATFDRLVFPEVSEDVTRMTRFRNRELDLFSPQPEQHQELLDDAALRERTQHYVYDTPTGGYNFIAWNQRRDGESTWFADKRVRQALTMLIDREAIVEDIYHGYATVATGPFHFLTDQYNDEIEPWPYDTDRALALLAEAGFERDRDGTLRDSDGEAFRFRLTFPTGSQTTEDMIYYLRDAFARAGIELRPNPLDWSIFRERLTARNFDAITLGWTGSVEGDPYQIFHSSQIAEGGDNFVSYRNEELDELIEAARSTVEEAERMPMWHEVHRILHEDLPYTFVANRQSMRWLDERFRNVEETTLGLNDRVEWYVPSELQQWAP